MSSLLSPVTRLLVVGAGAAALRLCQAGEELGIATHADEGEPSALVDRARTLRCDAVHPGELDVGRQRVLAEHCRQAGVRFLGLESPLLATLADSAVLRRRMHEAGLPLAPADTSGEVVRLSLLADRHGRVIYLPPRQRLPGGAALAPLPWLTPERGAYLGRLAAEAIAALGATGLIEAGFRAAGNAPGFVSLVPGPTGEEALDETLTGLDPLVEQLRLLQGDRLRVRQSRLESQGHARLWRLALPPQVRLEGGPGVRLDHPRDGGQARLVVWGRCPEALEGRVRRAFAALEGRGAAR